MTEQAPRERYREQVRDEIKRHAWEQITEAGLPALSLTAIAKRMSMTVPALYRYFHGRDELITALIRDAFRSLADTVRAAADTGTDLLGLAHVIRDWAKADPQRYFLLYGTPVPGYHAPADTTAISNEVMEVLIKTGSGSAEPERPTSFHVHLESHREWVEGDAVATSALRRALSFWTRLHGVLSLELAGHFEGMKFDPGLMIDDELAELRA
ncbi:TetR/AcrR family transcriptional regulator [Amycolatopsis silviterrae]|uniref:TetR/AcrR family transcriptional regulator n=1 Tax=Amycolatopsis silviterrae TaxID=1656914 RepID=A0ABW5H032_9PSEU